jgi:hypothetical protein
MADIEPFPYIKEGNVFHTPLVLNPEFRMLNLKYPIHIRPAEEATRLKGDYYVLILREYETGKVRFISLSVLFAYVIMQLSIAPTALNELIIQCANVFKIEDKATLKKELIAFAEDLLYQKMILGFEKLKMENSC